MSGATDIVIVGAGPFGLSIAAHLRERGLDFRIIGSPMKSWLNHMPKGMLLKSTGFSSTLYDPGQTFTIRHFCQEQGIPYHPVGLPVQLDTFSAYGLDFQKRFVPEVEDINLVALSRCAEGFTLRLRDGESIKALKVVLAVGIDYFRHIPEPLTHLPRELFSHSAEHHDLDGFRNRDVAILGGGSSAIDIAVLLHEAQAKVHLIVRKPRIDFGIDEYVWRPLLSRLRQPMSGIGPGWKNRFYTDFPWLIRFLPDHFRLGMVTKVLAPSGGWFMKNRAAAVPLLLGHALQEADVFNGRAQLRLTAADGSKRQISADHVIAATGYRNDVRRLPFLSAEILAQLKLVERTPRLSAHFESSVPGLYFVGPISATNFGPVMRFAIGAGFTARRISKHLAIAARRLHAIPWSDPLVQVVQRD